MRLRPRLALLVALAACRSGADPVPTGPEPSSAAGAYLANAIDIMQRSAYYRARVNWGDVRAVAARMAATASTPSETYPAIRYALAALSDRHSFLQLPASAQRSVPNAAADDANAAGAPVDDSLAAELLAGRFGYVHVPTFGVPAGTPDLVARVNAFADTLQALVRGVDRGRPCGWVVDLRHNLGGNMWPMLAGVGPILGEGTAGSFVDADQRVTTWYYQLGESGLQTGTQRSSAARVTGAPVVLARPNPPVAVLTDSLTASSGEAITIAFRGRPGARSFGAPTWGVPTANTGFALGDGAYLFLMTAVDADRTGARYDTRVPPDVLVPQSGRPATDDATVAAATAWLATQPACAAP